MVLLEAHQTINPEVNEAMSNLEERKLICFDKRKNAKIPLKPHMKVEMKAI